MDSILDTRNLIALAGCIVALAGVLLSRWKYRREVSQEDRALADERAADRESLRRKKAELAALQKDWDLRQVQHQEGMNLAYGKFRLGVSQEVVRFSAQNVIVPQATIESAPLRTRLEEESKLTVDRRNAEHEYKKKRAAIETEIEILKEKILI